MGGAEALTWHLACAREDVDTEEVVEVEVGGALYAVFRTPSGYHATAGRCTHEGARLADGLVDGEHVICPKHNSRFHIPTGRALRAPARVPLATYPVRVEGGKVYIGLPAKKV